MRRTPRSDTSLALAGRPADCRGARSQGIHYLGFRLAKYAQEMKPCVIQNVCQGLVAHAPEPCVVLIRVCCVIIPENMKHAMEFLGIFGNF